MGGFFGIASANECLTDVYYGVDYHSHLGTKIAGIASYDKEKGLQRQIHRINTTPFRTKFADALQEMSGTSAIGCISDDSPQPLLMRSKLGVYAICAIGRINNQEELIEQYLLQNGQYFNVMNSAKINTTELVAALINLKNDYVSGISFAEDVIDGTLNVMILKDDGKIIVARDYYGRLPVLIGKGQDSFAVTMESFAYQKLGMDDYYELGPNEIVELEADKMTVLMPARSEMKICSFLWSYYGYPTSTYAGVNVEQMRMRNGELMAYNEKDTMPDVDYICGVPDSGTPHAIGYSNASHLPFARPYIKYTPSWARSFIQPQKDDRQEVAKMKQIPVKEMITDKKLLFVDDSIVRGTQLKETVDFLKQNGAKSIHMRSACPPIMYGCKYLNFSRETDDMALLTHRIINELEGPEGFNHLDEYIDSKSERGKKLRERICEDMGFETLEFQTEKGLVEAIGLKPCELCTYCFDGKE